MKLELTLFHAVCYLVCSRLYWQRRHGFVSLSFAAAEQSADLLLDPSTSSSTAVFLVGLIIGPIYPIIMSVCTKVLPRHLHASGIGFIAAVRLSVAFLHLT